MSAPVDVLAVLRDYSSQHGNPEDFERVIAAVARLIEAAENVEVVRKWWMGEGSDSPKSALSHYTEVADRLRAARALCGGAK